MPEDKEPEKEAPIKALDETDIAFLKNYGLGPYATPIKKAEQDVKDILKRVNDVCGIKESDTGLAPPSRWDLVSDKQMQQEEQPLQVGGRRGRIARCRSVELRRMHAHVRACMHVQMHAFHARRWHAAPRSSTPGPRRPST